MEEAGWTIFLSTLTVFNSFDSTGF